MYMASQSKLLTYRSVSHPGKDNKEVGMGSYPSVLRLKTVIYNQNG